MPILNSNQRGLRIPKIGDIRKGVKVPVMTKKGNKEVPKQDQLGNIIYRPKEVDYWVFQIDKIEQEAIEILEQAYGPKPKVINCFLATRDKDQSWDVWYEAYTYNQLVARSDGNVIHFLFDVVTKQKLIIGGKVKELPNDPETKAAQLLIGKEIGDKVFHADELEVAEGVLLNKAVGRLNVVIPELERHTSFTVHTGGRWFDVPHITEMVETIFEISAQIGRPPTVIPFTLSRVERQRTYTKKDGKKGSRVAYDVQMELHPKIFKGMLKAYQDTPVMLMAQHQPALPEPPADLSEDEAMDQPYMVDSVSDDVIDAPPVEDDPGPQASKAYPRPEKESKAITEKPAGIIGWLLDQDIDETPHAVAIANKLKLADPKLSEDDKKQRYLNYRELRDSGKTPDEATSIVLGE